MYKACASSPVGLKQMAVLRWGKKITAASKSVKLTSRSIFQTAWQRIVAGTENLAASHETLALKIDNDVEKPLRKFNTSNREIQAVTSSQGNLASIAKDLESAQKKAAKGGRKAEEATSNVDEASRSWESQAPYVFEQLQALDERRVNHLRDVLTQFQTHEVDQVERTKASAESCLNALLNVEPADEIKTFAVRAAGGRTALARRRSSAAGSARPISSSGQIPPTPPPPRLSQRDHPATPYPVQGSERLAPPESTPHKSKLGGLKRFGTVMNRRKSAVPPPPPTSEKKEKKSRPFSAFRRGDSSRSFQDLEATGQDLTPTITEEPRNELTQVQSVVTEAPSDLTPPVRAIDTTIQQPQHMTNGTTDPPQAAPAPGTTDRLASPSEDRTDPMAVLSPSQPQQLQQQPQAVTSPQELPTQVSPTIQQGVFPTQDIDDSNRGFAIRDQPIQEDQTEAQAAMSSMANQLRMQAQTTGLNRVQGSVRGRRDVRNTMFFPAGVDTSSITHTPPATMTASQPISSSIPETSPAPDLASPIARPPPRAIPEDHPLGSDTTSIHSAHSLTTQPHHPELHDPGLNASIIETINTWFSESGVTKSFVTGEIALAYNASTTSPVPESETIKLQHFELLEKVAANPVFVSSNPKSDQTEDSAGIYSIATTSIRRSAPTVGLKYQLHIDESALAQYSPLLITPAWQLVEGQASIIVLYSLNPTFATSTDTGSITLKNVVISVSLDPSGPLPQSAMMAPQQHASFRRKAGSVIWRLPELVVKSEQERLLVRFTTAAGIPKKGSIEVRFELQGRGASSVGVERKAIRDKDPFADEEGVEAGDGWEQLNSRRMLVSGRYSAA